jgi:F-type H+-transporting ATPase subunit b
MTRNRRIFAVTSVFCLLLFAALSVRAAEEGGSAAAGHATEIFKWINFAIVLGIIFWLFGKYLPPKFRSRADSISSAIATATSAKAEADRQVREAEAKLARLQQEISELRAVAQREAAAEAERIRALAKSDAQKVGIAARAEIEAAERAARLELKALAARLAVDGAESLLIKQLTPAAQESLVDSFVTSLEGRPN